MPSLTSPQGQQRRTSAANSATWCCSAHHASTGC